MEANTKRTKFTTTLTNEHKRRLGILTAHNNKNGKNELLELLIDKEWKCYLNEMGNKQIIR
jgi:hypothetical protein